MLQEVLSNAVVNMFVHRCKDYFPLYPRYSPNLDSIIELKKLAALPDVSKPSLIEDNNRSQELLLYKRSPLQRSADPTFNHGQNQAVYMNAISTKTKFQVKSVFRGQMTYSFCVVSRDVLNLEAFELAYVSDIQRSAKIILDLPVEDAVDNLPLFYDVVAQPLSGFELVDYENDGSLWKLEFELTVSGLFFTLESFYYPKVLRLFRRYWLENRGHPVTDSTDTDLILQFKYRNVQDSEGRITGVELVSRDIEPNAQGVKTLAAYMQNK